MFYHILHALKSAWCIIEIKKYLLNEHTSDSKMFIQIPHFLLSSLQISPLKKINIFLIGG